MKRFVKLLLYPLSWLYAMGSGLRNLLYDWKIKKSHTFKDVKTVSVGNLIAGGSGKTPHVEYLINLLEGEFKIAVLSRGYKRKSSGYLAADENATPGLIGDEPYLYYLKHPQIQVAVDAKRVRGIENLVSSVKPELILLDDAFQHRAVKPDLSILLTEYSNPYFKDTFLPAGRLRESKKNAARADIIVVTKTPERTSLVDLRNRMKDIPLKPYQQLFFSYIQYGKLYALYNRSLTMQSELELYAFHVLLFTGIANNKPLVNFLREYAEDLRVISFKDHHNYSQDDLKKITEEFNRFDFEKKLIITTEKDAVKLMSADFKRVLENLPIFVIPIEIDFKDKTDSFNELILNHVRKNRIYHSKYSPGN